jgi:hypothetical protein
VVVEISMRVLTLKTPGGTSGRFVWDKTGTAVDARRATTRSKEEAIIVNVSLVSGNHLGRIKCVKA